MKMLRVAGMITWLLLAVLAGCHSRSVSLTEAEKNPIACALLVADTLGQRSEDLVADVALSFAKSGECDRAFRLVDSFKEKEWFRSNFFLASSKAEALGKISAICARNGNQPIADQAYASALQVLERNYSANVREEMWGAYNSLALHQAELGNLKEAVRLIAEHCHLGSKTQEDVRDCQISSWMEVAQKLDAVVNSAAASSFVKMAVFAVDQSNRVTFRAPVFAKAARVYFALGEDETGRELLKTALAEALKEGEIAYRDDLRQMVLDSLLSIDDFKQTEETIGQLELEYKRSWAWRELGVKMAESGDCLNAKRISEKISGFDDKASVYKAIVKRYAEHSDLQKAVEICEQVKGYGNRADARLMVARKYAQTNDLVNAKKFLDLAVEDAMNESSGSYHSQWSRHLQTALLMAAIGEKDRAISVIKEIGKQEISSGSLEDAAFEAAQEGNYDLAIEISDFVTTDNPCDHCWVVPKEHYKAKILIDSLLKHAEAKRKGLDQGKDVPQAVLKSLGLTP